MQSNPSIRHSALFAILLFGLLPTLVHAQVYDWSNFAGQPGSDGSADGTGDDARFWYPAGVAVDGGGVLYVVDSNNHRISRGAPGGSSLSQHYTLTLTRAVPETLAGAPDKTGALALKAVPAKNASKLSKGSASLTQTSVNAKTGLFKGTFTPEWRAPLLPVKKQPAFQGVLLQKGDNRGGWGFFLSNAADDPDPESGVVTLEAARRR